MKKIVLCIIVVSSTTLLAQVARPERPVTKEIKVNTNKKKIPSRLQERMQDEMQGVRVDEASGRGEN